ncbi:MAG: exonuclease domain-containing protein [Pyrinomonadaceae bacterium]|nr:exonuclease domain-containing protein [Pyrinomonadaceae bacterium]MCX7639262.1 exonuclease domain-containing protein [Pyrinomonadaceae bacterium]MDW8303516.1 exonuclease domain-containing protein [Acidobacteriota bacterium]
MLLHRNLISNSEKIVEAIKLLRSFGGRTSVMKFAKRFANISSKDQAQQFAEELSGKDPRIVVKDGFIEYIPLEKRNYILSESSFVVLDIEATDSKFPPGRILEIGAYKIKNRQIIGKFHSLVNPQTPVPKFIKELTGISDEMVEKSPVFEQLISDFLEFLDDSILVAHNTRFDVRLLNYEIGRTYESYQLLNPSLCTVQLSRKLITGLENYRLKTIANYYSIEIENLHRADDDSYATARIFMNLLSELENLGIKDLEGIKKLKNLKESNATIGNSSAIG